MYVGVSKMTRIKCRYSIPYCTARGIPWRRVEDYVFDESCEGGYCDIDEYRKPLGLENVVNPKCDHLCIQIGEFEKTVKNYEYDGGNLKIGRKNYYEDEIIYLEIDGRVLVDIGALFKKALFK